MDQSQAGALVKKVVYRKRKGWIKLHTLIDANETKTSFKRLMESEEVNDEKKEEVRKLKNSIDLYELNKKNSKVFERA